MDKFFTAANDAMVTLFTYIGDAWIHLCTVFFKPILIVFFAPINHVLAQIYQPWATISAITFFVGTMIWVWVGLKESYVNEGRRKKVWYTDLRIWTVCSMLPHVFVYFYFY